MTIGGEYRLEWIAARHWVRQAKELRIDGDAMIASIRGLAERVPDSFAQAAKEEAVRALASALPGRLTDAVGNRASWCLRLLDAS